MSIVRVVVLLKTHPMYQLKKKHSLEDPKQMLLSDAVSKPICWYLGTLHVPCAWCSSHRILDLVYGL